MKFLKISNIPNNPREIFDYAKSKSYFVYIDEKGTEKNPNTYKREKSDLSYEEAFGIVQANKPHNVICFRNNSYISDYEEDFWEFSTSNLNASKQGEVFIWIRVKLKESVKIFKKYNLFIK